MLQSVGRHCGHKANQRAWLQYAALKTCASKKHEKVLGGEVRNPAKAACGHQLISCCCIDRYAPPDCVPRHATQVTLHASRYVRQALAWPFAPTTDTSCSQDGSYDMIQIKHGWSKPHQGTLSQPISSGQTSRDSQTAKSAATAAVTHGQGAHEKQPDSHKPFAVR